MVAKYNRKAIFQEFSVISLRQNFSLNSSTMSVEDNVCEWSASVITIWFVWHNNGTHWKVTKFNRKTQRSDKYVSPDGQPSTSGAVAILKLKYNLFLAMWFLDQSVEAGKIQTLPVIHSAKSWVTFVTSWQGNFDKVRTWNLFFLFYMAWQGGGVDITGHNFYLTAFLS